MSTSWTCSALLLVCLVSPGRWARAGDAQRSGDNTATPAVARTVVLGDTSYWRMWHTLTPPVVDAVGGREPLLRKNAWLDAPAPAPPAGWTQPDFDDGSWLRTMAQGGCQTPYLARQCLRGKFLVENPAQVSDLRLAVAYHGGLVVCVNGQELARRHLPAQAMSEGTLAEGYPLEAFVSPAGDLLAQEGTYIGPGRKAQPPDAQSAQRIAGRIRYLQDFAIPPAALRKGINVLAVELIRAPYHQVLLETKAQAGGRNRHNKFDWYTCQLRDVQLTAASATGLTTNAGRPRGFQVWNSDPLAADGNLDYGDPCEPLRPIRLVGARGGTFSGKVVVGSTTVIAGLQATVGNLQGPGGVIRVGESHRDSNAVSERRDHVAESLRDSLPVSERPAHVRNIRVRYGQRWGEEAGFCYGDGVDSIRPPYPQGPAFFGALADAAPAEVPVEQSRVTALAGAVVPVWITVRVPRDVAPGRYRGELLIQARDQRPVAVPIQLEVVDCALPDPQEYRTWVELIEVPDVLAVEYGVPLWSERHWQMIADSFRLISDCGARSLYLPVIAHTNLGNAESMIRWIRKGPEQYEWDFSIMDRYLDLAEKHLGRPKVVVLQVWEIYMSTMDSVGKRFGPELRERHQSSRGGPLVTVLDPANGRTENRALPDLTDPASRAVWKELIDAVRRRLRKRGLEDALMLGMFTDAIPPREHIQFFHELAPDLPWVQQGHGRWKQKVYGLAEVGYQATVWGGFRFGDGGMQTNQAAPPMVQSLHGWRLPRLDAVFERNLDLDSYPSSRWRFYAETAITGELRGIGRIGADFWRAVKRADGRRLAHVNDRFPDGGWSGNSINLNLCSSTLAPGPDGPLATTRLLALHEGVQECEARIIIERVLTDERLLPQLDPELARRCQTLLDRRLHNMWRALCNYQLGGPFFFGAGAWRWTPGIPGHRWFLSSGWQDDSRQLYELAGQVQRAVGPRAAPSQAEREKP